MTERDDDAASIREDPFLDRLVPQVADHLAEQHTEDFDAEASRARFRAWLTEHTERPADPGGTRGHAENPATSDVTAKIGAGPDSHRTNPVTSPGFHWTTFDLSSRLPGHWQEEVGAAAAEADFHEFPRTPILSRESEDVRHISRSSLHASRLHTNLPWLYQLYREYFPQLAATVCFEPVRPALDERYGVMLHVQHGTTMRFECHVDSNPLTGLLFCTDHPAGAGGELVFGNDPLAASLDEVERDCSVIRPHAGHLIFFDGSKHPHYTRPLVYDSDVQIVVAMNFYTESRPESTRPPELNRHLFGRP